MMLWLVAMLAPDAPTVNPLFTNGAVLQRGKPIPVFGFGKPGETVTVTLDRQTRQGQVNAEGRWQVVFPKLPAGGPHALRLNDHEVANNVMVGEVWIASGQSNMEWNVGWTNQLGDARQSANPNVRMLTVAKTSVNQPAASFNSTGWITASENTVSGFSAVGYWFADRLQRETGVPVGVIHTSWGGTPAESWTSLPMLRTIPSMEERLRPLSQTVDVAAAQREYEQKQAEFLEAQRDKGNDGLAKGWAETSFNDVDWKATRLPGSLETLFGRDIDGAFWFRRRLTLSAAQVAKPATLSLGAIDDFDIAYVNGKPVGSTDSKTANWYTAPRNYTVPSGTLVAGENVIAVRVYDNYLGGGFTGPAEALRLTLGDENIPLNDNWRYAIEREITVPPAPVAPTAVGNPWTPASLYNGMIAPLEPYGIRGAIWYQGESNAGRAFQYRELFAKMIRDWRQRFKQGDFPFYYVQLANFMARGPEPRDTAWAELREAQTLTLKLPNTGMATAVDIGDPNDIHPQDKRSVGFRLAGIALRRIHGKPVVEYGPLYRRAQFFGSTASVEFNFADGLRTRGGRPVGFAVAGPDRKFVWAEATLDGNRVIVSSPKVPKIVAVRYGWDDNPAINVENAAGLPMFPFRTDRWPGITDKAK